MGSNTRHKEGNTRLRLNKVCPCSNPKMLLSRSMASKKVLITQFDPNIVLAREEGWKWLFRCYFSMVRFASLIHKWLCACVCLPQVQQPSGILLHTCHKLSQLLWSAAAGIFTQGLGWLKNLSSLLSFPQQISNPTEHLRGTRETDSGTGKTFLCQSRHISFANPLNPGRLACWAGKRIERYGFSAQ